MLTEEAHADGVAADRAAQHEGAAHEKRNWVRLTFDCNNRCIFCLDSDTHDGQMRPRDEVKRQILDGRRAGATRLILSGGEPTIHPDYVDFIRLGARAGYRKIQTVTNGRLFSYPGFLARCLDAGLDEITFSIHGPNARIHDALVGVRGAYEQEMAALDAAIADGRPIVNVDVVINRANVAHLAEMLEGLLQRGVRELDLLQVVPFGRAFTDGRDTLFYDLAAARPHLLAALEYSKRPDVHLWLNRFPPEHLEGYEHLIQDPYKLNDEVRGRKEEFARLLDGGVPLDCRAPERCRYCYLERLCDTLDADRARLADRTFEVVRFDATWEATVEAPFGGDPASARRATAERAATTEPPSVDRAPSGASELAVRVEPYLRPDGKRGLPVVRARAPEVRPVEEVAAGARRLWLKAASLPAALAAADRFPAPPSLPELELELDDHVGVPEALAASGDGTLGGRRLVRAVASTARDAERLLDEATGTFEVAVVLSRATAPWLLARRDVRRLVVTQPSHERLTDSRERDVDLAAFFAAFFGGSSSAAALSAAGSAAPARAAVPVEGVPACLSGRAPRPRPPMLDAATLAPDGRLDIFRFTRRYIVDGYRTRSLRCRECAHDASCDGLPINYVRAHGYAALSPVPRAP